MSTKHKKDEIDGADLDQDDICPSKRTHHYQFKEYSHVMRLIEELPKNLTLMREKERSYEQFLFIADSYQEQPHLIDPYLQEIFEKLIDKIKYALKENKEELIDEVFKYMYTLTKMRGFKTVVQFLPHEINDMEPVLGLLARQKIENSDNWHTRYMLLLWLSIICMIPFDLSRFDGTGDKDAILQRILAVCTVSLILKYL